jgi:tetratricopeptide (TPR) repeat protein
MQSLVSSQQSPIDLTPLVLCDLPPASQVIEKLANAATSQLTKLCMENVLPDRRHQQAKAIAREILNLNEPSMPLRVQLLYLLSRSVAQMKLFHEALGISQIVLEKKRELHAVEPCTKGIIKSLIHLGCLQDALKCYPEALATFNEALQLCDNNADQKVLLLNMMAIVLQAQGNFSKAKEYHQQALGLIPKQNFQTAVTLYYLAILHYRLKDTHAAMYTFVKACTVVQELYFFDQEKRNIEHFEEVLYCSLEATCVLWELNQCDSTPCLYLNWKQRWKRYAMGSGSLMVALQPYMLQFTSLLNQKKITIRQPFFPVVSLYKNFKTLIHTQCDVRTAYIFTKLLTRINLSFYGHEHSESLDCIESLGELSLTLCDFKEAKTHLEMAYHESKCIGLSEANFFENLIETRDKIIASKDQTRKYAQLAKIADLLGKVHGELGSFSDSVFFLNLAFQIRVHLFGKNHELTIASLNSLGVLARQLGKFDQALMFHEEALKHARPSFQTLNNLGLVLLDLGRTDESLQYFWQIFTLGTSMPLREFEESLQNIAHGLGGFGKFHEALDKLALIYSCREHTLGKEHYLVAETCCHMGYYQMRIGAYDVAKENYTKALAVQTNFFGRKHPVVANTLDNLGASMTALQMTDDAIQRHLEALDIKRAIFDKEHPSIAYSLDNLGFCFTFKGDYNSARSHFSQALGIREKCFDKEHPLIKVSQSYLETCEYATRQQSVQLLQTHEHPACVISRDQFASLIQYAKDFLDQIVDEKKIILEKNPTGFVRLRVPVPPQFSHIIEALRLNYWAPSIQIKKVEAPHNHPRYFESMIIRGGYTHNLFREHISGEGTHVASRIFKSNHLDRRDIFSVGKVHLQCTETVSVSKGEMVAFPRSIIHQVVTTTTGSLSINCVLKNESNRGYYEVYLPQNSPQDPEIDRDTLLSEQQSTILSEIKTILKTS